MLAASAIAASKSLAFINGYVQLMMPAVLSGSLVAAATYAAEAALTETAASEQVPARTTGDPTAPASAKGSVTSVLRLDFRII
ncbi:MAG TPA: hypothetical protein VFM56_06905 [Solimonas sp.]|nr:hypothetical protein [Solimonas sp.]